ncbi:MAG: flagellar filament capping protein FliD [Halanaerobiales bacterium]
MTATLQDTGTAEVSVNSDTDAVMEEVESFITEYNKTMDFLESDPMRENYNLYDSSGQIFNLFQDWQAGLLFILYS